MTSRYAMGLDAGGGGGRCVLVDLETGRMATAFRPWSPAPVPGQGWAFSFDAEANWERLCAASREAMAKIGAQPGDVVGVAATSMRHGLVVLDGSGRPLLAVPNRDGRSASEGMELAQQRGAELQRRTGHWPNPVFFGARLLWFVRQGGEAATRAAWALNLNEWLTFRLCGEAVTEPSQAAESLLFDLAQRTWAWDIVDSLGIPRRLLPEVLASGGRAGRLRAEAAEALGLRPASRIVVGIGGADTQCGLLAVGAVEAGQAAAIAGTTTPVQRVVDRPLVDGSGRLWSGAHVLPGLWVLESNGGSMGDALEWFARLLYPEAARPVELLLAEASEAPAGAGGILSSLGASLMDARQLSLPVGGLTFSHLTAGPGGARRANLSRAALEGMAYAVRGNLEQILAVDPAPLPELHLGGGLARSVLWRQILSDVVARPVRAPLTAGASACGAALCAAVAAGVFADLREAARTLVPAGESTAPAEPRSSAYQELYQGWLQLREARIESDGVAAAFLLQVASAEQEAAPKPPSPSGRPRILVTAEMDEESLARLRAIGEVEYASYREAMRLLHGPDLVEALQGRQVLVTEVDVLDAEALQALPDLRVVFACRGNVVNVDVAACSALGIPVLSAPGRNAEAVADLTLGFMLMLSRRLPEAAAFLRQPGGEAGDLARMGQAHEQFFGRELWGRTVGLIGLGAVGRAVARRLHPFGARLLVYDPYLTADQAAVAGAEAVPLDVLLSGSDIVSLHAAVTDETRGLIDAERLGRMKPGALLVNTARAALVDEQALAAALASGHLGGAALDVFAVEPPGSDHPLLQLANVLATPHIGGNTAEVAAHQGALVAEGMESLLRGDRPAYVLNPETLERFAWTGPRHAPAAQVRSELTRRPGPAVTDLEQMPSPAAASPSARGPSLLERGLGRLRGRADPVQAAAQLPAAPLPSTHEGAPMEKVIQTFLASLAADPVLKEYAKGHTLSMHYVLTEPALEFHMDFRDGQVSSGLGAPGAAADVRLKMKAEIFDKMLTGQINATKAAMTGKLSFSGDTRRAMGMQKVQGDMMRLYKQAREAVGAPTLAAGAPAVPAAPAAAAAAAPTVATVGDERDELVAVIRELYASGLITATGGNLSVRVPGSQEIWITPSALFKGDLRPELMVRLRLDGQVVDPEARSPSSEWRMHCSVFLARPDVEAIIHAHAPQATILTLSGLPFLPISTEAAFLGDVARVPFIMPGTAELAEAVAQALGGGPAVLLQNHGILVAGSSLRRAADMAEVLERTAEVILGCYAVGKEPPLLPQEALATLREVGKMMA